MYFVTICTRKRINLFGRIREARMQPNALGKIIWEAWFELPYHFARLELDSFVLMPSHIHGILALVDPVGAGLRPAPALGRQGLTRIIGAFKSFSSRRITEVKPTLQGLVWQRSFYDRIIRNNAELSNARRYILLNPAKWEFDRENRDHKDVKTEGPAKGESFP